MPWQNSKVQNFDFLQSESLDATEPIGVVTRGLKVNMLPITHPFWGSFQAYKQTISTV